MRVTQFLDGRQFDQKRAFDQQVRAVLADHDAVVMHFDAARLLYGEARIAQLVRQSLPLRRQGAISWTFSRYPVPSVFGTRMRT